MIRKSTIIWCIGVLGQEAFAQLCSTLLHKSHNEANCRQPTVKKNVEELGE